MFMEVIWYVAFGTIGWPDKAIPDPSTNLTDDL
jgi:hypothetical protein